MKKRIFIFLFILTFTISLSACNDNTSNSTTSDQTTTQETTTTEEDTTTTEETEDNVAPNIMGTHDFTLTIGNEVPDWLDGVSATDDVDGIVEVTIQQNTVDLSTPGIYYITYEASDSSNNVNTEKVTVTVEDDSYESSPEETYVEDFSNVGSGMYDDLSFTGVEDIYWTILGARSDQQLDGTAVTFGGMTDGSKLYATIDGGISSFSVEVKKEFSNTNERALELFINGESYGVHDVDENTNNVAIFEVTNINISGTFTLELRHITGESSRAQITIDNLTWTSYGGVTVPEEQQNLNRDLDELMIQTRFYELGTIDLPTTGQNGSQITWNYYSENDSNNEYIDLDTNQVLMPNEGQETVTLEAVISNGTYTAKRIFHVIVGKMESITINEVRSTTNGTKINTTGTITDFYTTSEGIYFFMQDSSAGIFVFAPSSYLNDIQVGNEVRIEGTKNNDGQVIIEDITNLTVLGTKVIEGTLVTDPLALGDYHGELVEVQGLLKYNYTSNATKFMLVNEHDTFELILPSHLSDTVKSEIISNITGKDSGLLVEVIGGVNNLNQILLMTPSNIDVANSINNDLVENVLRQQIDIPTYSEPVTSNLSLPTYSNVISGINIEWTSNNESVLSSGGTITRQHQDIVVRLSYSVKFHGEILYTDFIDVIVASTSNYEGYYASLDGLTGDALFDELQNIISNHITVSYGDARYILDETDANPNYTGNVLLVYNRASVSGEWSTDPLIWNREHVWPKSKLGVASDSDLHNLKPSDPNINNTRGSLPFMDGSGSYGTVSGGWFPGEEDKGDIARIIFYMNTRWGLSIDSSIGDLETFIEWHLEDPVDEFERNRNQIIFDYQGNRNPYVDYPELVEEVYGTVSTTSTVLVDYNYMDEKEIAFINETNDTRKKLIA